MLELRRVEAGGQDLRVILGGGQGILNKRDAVRPGLEGALARLGREIDEKRPLLEPRLAPCKT